MIQEVVFNSEEMSPPKKKAVSKMEVGAVWPMTFFDISPVEGGISESFHQGSPDVLMEFIQTQWVKFRWWI